MGQFGAAAAALVAADFPVREKRVLCYGYPGYNNSRDATTMAGHDDDDTNNRRHPGIAAATFHVALEQHNSTHLASVFGLSH